MCCAAICAAMGWMIVIAGICLAIIIWRDEDEMFPDKIITSFYILVICGIAWWGLNIDGMFYVNKNIEITYVQPTSIVKTNARTMVNYINIYGFVIARTESTDASWYIATNIMVKVKSGNNIYGNPVADEYEIVMR